MFVRSEEVPLRYHVGHVMCGLAVALAARVALPNSRTGAFLPAGLLATLAAWAAGLAGEKLGFYHAGQRAGFFMSSLGAIALLLIYSVLTE